MTLNEYMKTHGITDESFAKQIGKSRMQVFRYRHGEQIPGKETMSRILKKTAGCVDPASFYLGITASKVKR